MRVDAVTLKKVVPHALTLGNGLCGVAGLIVLTGYGSNKAYVAAVLIFAGWVFDMVDGIAARRLGTTGPFGAALDSICDAVTFGALPAVLVGINRADTLSLLCAVAFACGAFVRLARYMAHAARHEGPRWYFDGLPSPAAAMMVASAVLLQMPAWQSSIIAVIAAAAMVSQLPYADLPRFYLAKRWPWMTALVPLVAAVVLGMAQVAAAVLAAYLLSGPAVYLSRLRKPAAERA
jgi:CDP-diacylglycerol--serine O-phosphatidyltransferase